VAIDSFRKRYVATQTLGSKLPSDDTIELPKNIDLCEIATLLQSDFVPQRLLQTEADSEGSGTLTQDPHTSSSDTFTPAVSLAAFGLTLFGWQVDGDGSTGLVECRACFRRLGLWMYKPRPNGDLTVYSKLNVVDEHMDYCPWVNSHTQSGVGSVGDSPARLQSGWQILIQNIRNKHRRLTREDSSQNLRENSNAPSGDDPADENTKKARDREWWSKIRRVREVLHVKVSKKTSADSVTSAVGH
jgi:hypothetical protein